eukprot:5549781-Pyramimonas_sp.AAC.1
MPSWPLGVRKRSSEGVVLRSFPGNRPARVSGRYGHGIRSGNAFPGLPGVYIPFRMRLNSV